MYKRQPLVSRRNALFIKNEMPGIYVPDRVVEKYKENASREEYEELSLIHIYAIDKYVDIIDRYGVDDNRSMMRCMRKLAIACGMKGRLLLEYEGKVTEV